MHHFFNTDDNQKNFKEISQGLLRKLCSFIKELLVFKLLYWQKKHICEYKRGKVFAVCFSDNAAKIWSCGLNILRYIDIKYLLDFQSYFNLLDTFDKGCMSVLKVGLLHESPLKMLRNAFYLILKALFVLKI